MTDRRGIVITLFAVVALLGACSSGTSDRVPPAATTPTTTAPSSSPATAPVATVATTASPFSGGIFGPVSPGSTGVLRP